MDFSKFPNPYDFANPVNDPDLFVGRAEEIKDIKYYIDHADKTSRPINLALIGERASGKTSMLNRIEVEAKKRNFCTVRVNLDEEDAKTQLNLFYKIFDSILTEVCSLGGYEGLGGKTYDVYCDIVSSYEIPKDNTFSPFIFPIRYAKAASKGNLGIALPATNFQRDISNIQKEINRTIVILFDECDVLSHSRVHLQQLRNIFMNVEGYLLVMTGTPEFFPIIDEVFSPIIRQFKKIQIGPFNKELDTGDCIQKPLEKIGIEHPDQIFDLETFFDVREVHDLTGGRPYEIQLLCHILFRRIQEGRATKMKLSLDVLDDVLSELSTTQDVSIRPVLNAVKNLEIRELSALELLCKCNGKISFQQVWAAEYIFWGEDRWKKDELERELTNLVNKGIMNLKDDIICFSGDEFDRIYSKYQARRHNINLAIRDLPYEILLGLIYMDRYFSQKSLKEMRLSTRMLVGKIIKVDKKDVLTIHKLFAEKSDNDPFTLNRDVAIELYWSNIEFRDKDTYQAGLIKISTQWTTLSRWFRYGGEENLRVCPEISFEFERLKTGQTLRIAQFLTGYVPSYLRAIPK